MLEVKYYLKHVLISIVWVFYHINSLWKHSINVPSLIWSSVVMIESEKSWKHVSIFDIVHGMIETLGISKATHKMNYTEYTNLVVVAWT